MARIRPLAAALALIASGVASRAADPPPTQRADAWREAVEAVVDQLPARHPDWFARTPEPAWKAAADDLRARAAGLDEQVLALELGALIALGGDSHTALRTPAVEPPFDRLPVQLAGASDGFFVAAAADPHHDLIGARVTAFGPLPAELALEKVARLFAWENDAWKRRTGAGYLALPAALELIGATEDRKSVELTLAVPGEPEPRTVTLACLTPGASGAWSSWVERLDAAPLAIKGARSFYRCELVGNAMYVQYNRCQSAPDYPFPAFARFVLDQCESHDARRIIIDLRLNTGGDERVIHPLTDALASSPRFAQPGSIVVLIGPSTYSSGLGNALTLRGLGAVLVGEPTGGKPNHFGEVRAIELPSIGAAVFHSTREWNRIRDADPDSLTPDVRAPARIEDILAGRDPALDAALAYEPTAP